MSALGLSLGTAAHAYVDKEDAERVMISARAHGRTLERRLNRRQHQLDLLEAIGTAKGSSYGPGIDDSIIWLSADYKKIIRFSNLFQSRHFEMMTHRKGLSPDEIATLLREISKNESDVFPALAHKTSEPIDLTSTYSVCTRRVFGGTGIKSRPSGSEFGALTTSVTRSAVLTSFTELYCQRLKYNAPVIQNDRSKPQRRNRKSVAFRLSRIVKSSCAVIADNSSGTMFFDVPLGDFPFLFEPLLLRKTPKKISGKVPYRFVTTWSSETWTMTEKDEYNLGVFEHRIIRALFGGYEVVGIWQSSSNGELFRVFRESEVVK
ncbi:hypothetical protein TNCV_3374311 [Trichonephila clavipes]|nr:hypothetical protein TNCV_3374311 [Trichonephila clavipes]